MQIIDKYYKKTEQLLYNYKMLLISIDNILEEIALLKQEDGMTGISYDGVSTSPTNKTSSMTEDIAISNVEKIDYLEHSIRRTKNNIEKIDKAMEGLNETELALVKSKYIDNKQWWKAAYQIGYSERHCRRIRRDAIQKMAIGIYGDRAIEKGEEDGEGI